MDRLLPETHLALAVKKSNLSVKRGVDAQIEGLGQVIKARIKPRPEFQPLLSVSGIGEILGWTILLETGAISRFAEVDHYASYCRCVGSERLSNGQLKRPSGPSHLDRTGY